jgi:glutaredoxin
MAKLIMYSLATCPTCEWARTVLRERGVDFEERIVDDNPEWWDDVFRLSGQDTVPIFVHPDGQVEVGFEGERG